MWHEQDIALYEGESHSMNVIAWKWFGNGDIFSSALNLHALLQFKLRKFSMDCEFFLWRLECCVASVIVCRNLCFKFATIWRNSWNVWIGWNGKKNITWINAYLVDTTNRWITVQNAKVSFRHVLCWRYQMHLLVWYWHCQVGFSLEICDLDQIQPLRMHSGFYFHLNNIHQHSNSNVRDWFFYHFLLASSFPGEFVDPWTKKKHANEFIGIE